eukprot:scaffold99888_cov46-Cyclotella_meneghiniana.AAC.1
MKVLLNNDSVKRQNRIIRRDGYWHIADEKGNVQQQRKQSLQLKQTIVTTDGIAGQQRSSSWIVIHRNRRDVQLISLP